MWWLSLIPIIGTIILGIFLHNWEDNEERRSINRMADRDRKRMGRKPPQDSRRMRYATIGGKASVGSIPSLPANKPSRSA